MCRLWLVIKLIYFQVAQDKISFIWQCTLDEDFETGLPLTRSSEGEKVISSLNSSMIPWNVDQFFNGNLDMNTIMC